MGCDSKSKKDRQRKKDRIDTFYKAVLEKEQKVSLVTSAEELEVLKLEVHELRNQAFTALIEERLDANPSFLQLSGYSADQLILHTEAELRLWDDRAAQPAARAPRR